MNMQSFAVSALLMLMLASCSPFRSNQPPVTIYALHAEAAKPETATRHRVIAVAEPSVPQGFETGRLAVYLDGGRRMDYAAGAAWPGPLAKVLQDFIIQSAAAQPGLLAVKPDDGAPAARLLLVRVNDFQPVYRQTATGTPLLRLSLTFTLMSGERMLSTFSLAEEKPASANGLAVMVSEMEAMLRGILDRAFEKLRRDMGRRGRPA